MKATLFAMFVALLMVGCGEEEQIEDGKNGRPAFSVYLSLAATDRATGGDLTIVLDDNLGNEEGLWLLVAVDEEGTKYTKPPNKEMERLRERLLSLGVEVPDDLFARWHKTPYELFAAQIHNNSPLPLLFFDSGYAVTFKEDHIMDFGGKKKLGEDWYFFKPADK
jgi:hypothetical protein